MPAPGRITSGPTVASFAPDRLDIFVKGIDNQYYHTWWDSRINKWERIGGIFVSDPDAVSFRPIDASTAGPARVDVFGRGGDNQIWHTWWP